MATDIHRTFGAVLLGGLVATLLSGTVVVQNIIYHRLYPNDPPHIKILVLAIFFLDVLHTCFIWVSNWIYLILHYGESGYIDQIPWSLALTIVLTAILTFLVHCFLAHRIFLLSKKNWVLVVPIAILAVARLAAAATTTAEMIRLQTFTAFKVDFKWVFTLGLALSTAIDILITGSLFHLLRRSRSTAGAEMLNNIIDSLILYAFETGALTCAGTIIAMLCWLTMPSNLIFVGIHFVIGKFYAISLLVTLNTRQSIRHGRSVSSGEAGGNAILVMDTRRNRAGHPASHATTSGQATDSEFGKPSELHVNVERSVQYTRDSYDGPKVIVAVAQ